MAYTITLWQVEHILRNELSSTIIISRVYAILSLYLMVCAIWLTVDALSVCHLLMLRFFAH